MRKVIHIFYKVSLLLALAFISIATYAFTPSSDLTNDTADIQSATTSNTITYILPATSYKPKISFIYNERNNFEVSEIKGNLTYYGSSKYKLTITYPSSKSITGNFFMFVTLDGKVTQLTFSSNDLGKTITVPMPTDGSPVEVNIEYFDSYGSINKFNIYKKLDKYTKVEVIDSYTSSLSNVRLPEGEYYCFIVASDRTNKYFLMGSLVDNKLILNASNMQKIHVKNTDKRFSSPFQSYDFKFNEAYNQSYTMLLNSSINEMNVCIAKDTIECINCVYNLSSSKYDLVRYTLSVPILSSEPMDINTDLNLNTSINLPKQHFEPDSTIYLQLGSDISVSDSYGNLLTSLRSLDTPYLSTATFTKGSDTFTAIANFSNNQLKFKTPSKTGEYDFKFELNNDLPVKAPAAEGKISIQSDRADLNKLSISSGTLTPAFNRNITNYTVTVDSNISEINIWTYPCYSGTQVTGNGKHTLDYGENPIDITVKYSDDITKTYSIVVTRKQDSTLKELTLNKGTLYPTFRPSITNYSLTVDKDISTLDVTALPTDENATVTGCGSYNLKYGVNPITG